MNYAPSRVLAGSIVVGMSFAAAIIVAATIDPDYRPTPVPGMPSQGTGERVISEPTENLIPGDRVILGRVIAIRSQQLEVDIGNPQPLYLPLQPAKEKHQLFSVGDTILVTMNDHNAVVDYHHENEPSRHQVIKGRLKTSLTVGLDKAVITTHEGTKTFSVADRAKGKLEVIPVGVEAWFLADETGVLVDAQLGSARAVEESAKDNKARLLGAHAQRHVVFQGVGHEGKLRVTEAGKSKELPVRPPLAKLGQLKAGQDVVLLTDEEGYVLDIATPDVRP